MTNGFSKHFIRIALSLSLVLSLIVGSSAPALAAGSSTIDVRMTVTYGQTEARTMLDYINKFRSGQDVDGQKADYHNKDNTSKTDLTGKLSPLTYDYNLEKVAMQRAAEVAMTFEHTRPDGTDCFTAWNGSGSWNSAGENIAGNSSASALYAFRQWREDDDDYSGQGHRRNMLSENFTRIGIGHVVYNGVHYWTHAFGKGSGSDQATAADDSERQVTITVLTSSMKNYSVSIAPSSYEMTVGESADLPAVTLNFYLEKTWPRQRNTPVTTDVIWSSDKSSIAIVNNGKLEAKASGSANLSASVNGSALTVPVTVNEAHTHTLVATPAKAATEEAEGNSAYWTCSGCGKYYSDAEGKNEIGKNSWVIAKLPHTHNLVDTPAKAATEEASGNSAYWTCSKCGKYYSDAEGKNEIEKNSWIIPVIPHTEHVHTLKAIPARQATYKAEGNSAYWTCSGCGKYYSDAEGKKEIGKNSWLIPKLAKKAQPMTVKAAKKKIKASKLKKKAQKISVFTIKDAKGKISYKIIGGNKKSKTALKINSESGKITVKKKTKKGSYTVTVKVTAAGNDQFNAGSKDVKVTVKVK